MTPSKLLYRLIPLTQGQWAVVDTADYDMATQSRSMATRIPKVHHGAGTVRWTSRLSRRRSIATKTSRSTIVTRSWWMAGFNFLVIAFMN